MLVYTDLIEVTADKFLKDFRRHTTSLAKEDGKPLGVKINNKQYVVLPFSAVDGVKIKSTNTAYTETARDGGTSFYQDLKLTSKKFSSDLADLGNDECFVITIPKQDNICVITKDAFEQMEYRKNRQAARAAKQKGEHPPLLTQDIGGEITKIPETVPDAGPTPTPAEDIATIQEVPQIVDNATMQTPAIITQSLSHWDNTKANHREENLDESVTLHREKPVGVLISAERANQMGLPCETLSDKEVTWATRFKDNHTGFKSLLPQAGLVSYKGQTHYYVSLGYFQENQDQFNGHIAPELVEKLQQEYQRLDDALLLEYFRKLNPVSLSQLGDKTGLIINAVNGQINDSFNQECLAGIPVAGLHSTKLKMIVLPGDQTKDFPGDIEVLKGTSATGYRKIRSKLGGDLKSGQAILITYGNNTVTILPASVEHDAIKHVLESFAPQLQERVNIAIAPLKNFESGRPNAPSYNPGKPEAAKPCEAAITAPEIIEPTVEKLEERLVAAVQPAATAALSGLVASSDTMKNIIDNLLIVTEALETLKQSSHDIYEKELDGAFISGFHNDVFEKLPLADTTTLTELYNSLKQNEEPEAVVETVEFAGTAASKMKALRSAFDHSAKGKIVVLRAEDITLLVTRNHNFMEFVSEIT